MAVLNNTGIRAGASGAGGDAYQIEKSLRFNGADSAYLSKTFSSASSTTHSVSFWLKRCITDSTTYHHMFNSTEAPSCGVATYGNIIYIYNATHTHATGRLLRDPSAWYHVMLSVSSGTAALYVNNEEVQSGITGWTFGSTGRIGGWNAGGYFLDGYLAEIYHVDGQALTASDFGETNATTGQWVPKEYSGSYGTNGFYLKFNGTDLGEDSSGQGNDWTPSTTLTASQLTTVGEATGGLPIYNTSGDFGGTKESGYRTDSSAGTTDGTGLVLAIPGDTTTDVHASINTGSSAKTLSTSGTVSTSTAESKFYGTSIDMTSATAADHWTVAASSDFAFGTGSFTIEWWQYWDDATGYQSIFDCGYVDTGALLIQSLYNTAKHWIYLDGGDQMRESTPATLQEWTHYALVKNGNTLTFYRNGVVSAPTYTTTNSVGLSDHDFHIGADEYNYKILGYIQDFRVYKGVAKYTSAFSVVKPESLEADVSTDSPTAFDDGGNGTGNYCTWNPLNTNANLSDGNLKIVTNAAAYDMTMGTFGISSGKWYWEGTWVSGDNRGWGVGTESTPSNDYLGWTGSWGYMLTGVKVEPSNSQSSYGNAFTVGDIISVAFDADNGVIWFAKNGTWQNSATTGEIAAGTTTNACFTGLTSGPYFPYTSNQASLTGTKIGNFGQRAWAYPDSVPDGFKALNTYNLDDTEILSGEYKGNADDDGPVIWMNATPATLKIDTTDPATTTVAFDPDDVDPLAGGFKIRNSSDNNGSGTTYYWLATTDNAVESAFKYANAQSNE